MTSVKIKEKKIIKNLLLSLLNIYNWVVKRKALISVPNSPLLTQNNLLY